MKKLESVTSFLRHILVSALVAALTVGPAAPAFADPTQIAGGNVAQGIVKGSTGAWTISAPNGSIIHFSNFDIHEGQSLTFIDGNTANPNRVLNRVFSANPTHIDGTLSGQGYHLYIVNPAGVIFGSGAEVNANSIHAAAGRMSDTDFKRGETTGVDHYTGLRGRVENAGAITADAVSLVGGKVANSGQVTATNGGWVVMAAGRDVLIGRDSGGNGVLLRVEGAASAIFDKNARGVENTGSLTASSVKNDKDEDVGGHVTLGAGDMYGTAIFSTGAIEARRLALSADDRGDVALGGTVKANEVTARFVGDKNGQLKGVDASAPTAIVTNNLSLAATSDRGVVKVGDGLTFRALDSGVPALKTVTVEQRASLATSDLAGVKLEGDRSNTVVKITSNGALAIDDRALVNGTKLDLAAGSLIDVRGADALSVDSLKIVAASTFSRADIIATGADGIDATTNFGMVTRPESADDPAKAALISAHAGTLRVSGDITTSDGGGLRLEAKEVTLGRFDELTGPFGGNIDISGGVQPRLEIGFVENGVQQTKNVTLNTINTQGRQSDEDADRTAGGDVLINATGNVTVRGSILTDGDAGNSTTPRMNGGSVNIATTGDGARITVGSIFTGGADRPAPFQREHGRVSLTGANVVLNGDISTRGGNGLATDDGSRDRRILIDGNLLVGSVTPSLEGGDVTVTGYVAPNVADLSANLRIASSGATRLGGGVVNLESLSIASLGGPMSFGGDMLVDGSIDLLFRGAGEGQILADGPLTMSARSISLGAAQRGVIDGTTASVTVDQNVRFILKEAEGDLKNDETNDDIARGVFIFDQDRAIDATTTAMLFTPGRFSVSPAPTDPPAPPPLPLYPGLVNQTVQINSHGAVTFDANARAALTGADVVMAGKSFTATGAGTPFNLRSLDLATRDSLVVDFDVTASGEKGITLLSGFDGTSDGTEQNDGLQVNSRLAADSITLIAGVGSTDDDPTTGAKVGFGANAQLRAANGSGNAKKVVIAQDASLDTASLPDPSLYGATGDPLAGLDYQLQSHMGVVSVTDAAKVANTKLTLIGGTGVDLGAATDPALQLQSLTATTAQSLEVARDVITAPGGKIELRAGLDGTSDLTIDSLLAGDEISLFAGSGFASDSRVVLDDGARFRGAVAGATSPKSFVLEQDAAIGGSSSNTQAPGASLFAGGISGMKLALRSNGSTVTIADSANVDDTFLELVGQGTNGVTISDDLSLRSLEVTGGLKLTAANVTATGDVTLNGAVSLDAKPTGDDPNAPAHQTIDAGGALTAKGNVIKTTLGDVTLDADGAINLTSAATSGSGSNIAIGNAETDSVKVTGVLNASSNKAGIGAGGVTVTSAGDVDVIAIDTRGAHGNPQQSGTVGPTNGTHGGDITVRGAKVKLGTVSSSGGDGGNPDRTGFFSKGGDAGKIEITSTNGIDLGGDILAQGGAGFSTDTANPSFTLRGSSGDVTLVGDLRLFATGDASERLINHVSGNAVAIRGDVSPGTRNDPNAPESDDPNAPIPQIPIPANFTGLEVVADQSLEIDGDITAGLVDLELHNGALTLKQDPGANTVIHADDIRLAATDGHSDLATNKTNGMVDLSRFTFAGSDGAAPVKSFALEQDASIGGAATPIPLQALFNGDGTENRTGDFVLSLISHDGSITLGEEAVRRVAGTNLTLAANGESGATGPTIQIDTGAESLELTNLTLGVLFGVGDTAVGGDTRITGDVVLGNPSNTVPEVLSATGDLTIAGAATLFGSGAFEGGEKQTLAVTGPLALKGSLVKSSKGDFDILADDIRLTGDGLFQSLASRQGALLVSSPLVKNRGTLSLGGVTESTDKVAVTVKGTRPGGLAVETKDGALLISATTQSLTPGVPSGLGTYQVDGSVRAAGDITTTGRAILAGGQPSYSIEAVRNADLSGGGILTFGGIASADGAVKLVGEGRKPNVTDPDPVGVRLNGDIAIANHALTVDGVTEVAGNTAIEAGGPVEFLSLIRGAKNLDVRSHDLVAFHDDVAMTAGQFSARADNGVRFVSLEDRDQVIQAGSISLGAGVPGPAAGKGSLLRSRPGCTAEAADCNADLRLTALDGNVTIARGQRLMVNGDLDVAATGGVTLADTSALTLDVTARDFGVYAGTTVVANRIATNSAPRVLGGGGATFAVPTRTEITDNIPSDSVLVRAISGSGAGLTLDESGAFDPIFPAVSGAAIFDYARIIPQQNPRATITRPYADPIDLDAALQLRPLWAEELLAYLEQRSVESPDEGKPFEAEQLPPVGARPGEPVVRGDARVRTAAVENAVAVYRDLFRPSLRRDPESGVIDGPSHSAAIKSAFQEPVDALRHAQSGGTVSGAEVASLLESDPRFDQARQYRGQLGALLDLSSRALAPDQQPRFRALVLAEVTPYGMTPAEFSSLF